MTSPMRQSIQLWIADRAPLGDESGSGLLAPIEVNDFWIDTDTGTLWRCTAAPDQEHLVWLWENPQADWEQEDEDSLDFIKNKPANPVQSVESRSLNSAFLIDSTRNAFVFYSVDISAVLSLTSGQSGTVFLEIASDSGFTEDVQELGQRSNGNTGNLSLGNTTDLATANLSGFVPANFYCRLRTNSNTGSPAFTYKSGQKILF